MLCWVVLIDGYRIYAYDIDFTQSQRQITQLFISTQ